MVESIVLFIVLTCSIVGYFLPALIANTRKHRNENSILIINLFLGWTLVGWVVALAMAFSSDTKAASA